MPETRRFDLVDEVTAATEGYRKLQLQRRKQSAPRIQANLDLTEAIAATPEQLAPEQVAFRKRDTLGTALAVQRRAIAVITEQLKGMY